MAENIAGNLMYYVALPAVNRNYLGAIRHWQHLKIAVEENEVWVKDFLPSEIEKAEVQSLPARKIYYVKGNQLFKQGSLLPQRVVPALLWTPIDRALPIKLPSFNHNYFGINAVLDIQLKRVDTETAAAMLLTTVQTLKTYMESAPAVRLKNLQWVMLKSGEVLVFGTPLLPLPGTSYWQYKSFFILAGFDFEWNTLKDIINDEMDPDNLYQIIWREDGTYFKMEKSQIRPLTRASFRATINQ